MEVSAMGTLRNFQDIFMINKNGKRVANHKVHESKKNLYVQVYDTRPLLDTRQNTYDIRQKKYICQFR